MKKYQDIETDTPETFKRMTGLSKSNLPDLCYKVDTHIKNEKRHNPLKQWGLKKSTLTCEDRVLGTVLPPPLSNFFECKLIFLK